MNKGHKLQACASEGAFDEVIRYQRPIYRNAEISEYRKNTVAGQEELMEAVDDPLFDFEVNAEAGLVAGANFKLFGFGGAAKAGISKELINGYYCPESGARTTYGGKWRVAGELGYGVAGIYASSSFDGDANVGGNLLVFKVNSSLDDTNMRITLFEAGAVWGIGGNLKITMSPTIIFGSPHREFYFDDYRQRVDATYVSPYRYIKY